MRRSYADTYSDTYSNADSYADSDTRHGVAE
jgi:hypothetical protein